MNEFVRLRLEWLHRKIVNTKCNKILEKSEKYGMIRCGQPFAQDGDCDVVRFCDKCQKKRDKLEQKRDKLEQKHGLNQCVVCGKEATCGIGMYSNLVCDKHAEDYKKGNKEIVNIVDRVNRA